MVEFDEFFIPHIGKTGGDAIKQIVKQLGLPIVDIREHLKFGKHVAPRHLFGKKDMVLSIRRLPSREISKLNQLVYVDKTITWDEVGNPAEWILRECQAEKEIKKNTDDGTVIPKMFIRSESLRDDLLDVLRHYFNVSKSQEQTLMQCSTKDSLVYCRDLYYWFSPKQIAELYDKSPVWSRFEQLAYPSWRKDHTDNFKLFL